MFARVTAPMSRVCMQPPAENCFPFLELELRMEIGMFFYFLMGKLTFEDVCMFFKTKIFLIWNGMFRSFIMALGKNLFVRTLRYIL